MQVRVNRTSAVAQEVEVTIPEQDVKSLSAKKLKQKAASAKVDGFRPGKAPFEVVKRRFGNQARLEAIEQLVNDATYKALQQEDDLKETVQFSQPQPKGGVNGGDLVFTFVAENFPKIDVKDYKGVAVELVRSVVNAEAVDAEIQKLRDELTALVPVEGRNTVQAGDVVRVNYRGLGDGPQSEMSQDDQEIDLTRGDLLPGVAEGFVGAEKGVKKAIPVTLPEEFPLDELKGKQIELEIEVLEILERKVPELNDELAKESGRAETLAELRAQIENKQLEGIKNGNEQSAKTRLLDAIVEKNPVEVPRLYLQQQAIEQVSNQLEMFKRQGIDWQKMNLDVNRLLEASVRDLEPQLKRSFILQAIAAVENIQFSQEEVQAEVARIAAEQGQPESRIIAQLGGEAGLSRLQFGKQMDRVLDFVWSAATISEVDSLTPAAGEQEA